MDLLGEIGGILPSPAYKYKTRKERWYPGDTVNIAIGQGDWKVTPLQLVRGVSAIASGLLLRPHLVLEERTGFDHPWEPMIQPPGKPISPNPAHLQVVREGMMDTMRPGGTGYAITPGAPYQMAGKTGTAQVVSRKGVAAVDPRSLPLHLRHRGLFVGFAPADHPVIAVAVAVEGGGFGTSSAAPIARKIFDAWLLGKMPAGLEPLDSELGMTAVGVNRFEAGVTDARAAGDAAAATLDELPVVVGQTAVALDPNTPAQPVVPDVPDAVQETDH